MSKEETRQGRLDFFARHKEEKDNSGDKPCHCDISQANLDCLAANFQLICLGRIAAGIVHDLSNPLTSLSLGLEIISEESCDKESRRIASQARLALERMRRLIGIIKTHINGENISTWFVANEEIADAIKMMRFQAKCNHCHIFFRPNGQIKLYGCPEKFGQIACNLLGNALEALRESDKREVYVNLWQNGGLAFFSVRDTGPGFGLGSDPFKAFFSTKKGPDCHLGLGLSIIKHIVEVDFKGEISGENTSKGTRFLVTIPNRPE